MYIPDKLFEKINDPPCTMLFVWLIHLADVNGVVSASYIDIAADIGYSKTQVYRYVQTLSKLGALGTSLERNRLKITITGYDTYKRKPSGVGTKLEQKNERYFEDKDMNNAMLKWLAYKREKKQTYKPRGIETLKTKLFNLSKGDGKIAMLIVEQSMSNNYSGLFPLKDVSVKPVNSALPVGMNLQNSKNKDYTKGLDRWNK